MRIGGSPGHRARCRRSLAEKILGVLGRPVWGEAMSPAERLEILASLARQGLWVRVYSPKIGS